MSMFPGSADSPILLFAAIVLLNVAGLVVDLVLDWAGWTTISQLVWMNGWVGLPIIVLQAVGLVALALHFYGPMWE
jgi:hypothetical protein